MDFSLEILQHQEKEERNQKHELEFVYKQKILLRKRKKYEVAAAFYGVFGIGIMLLQNEILMHDSHQQIISILKCMNLIVTLLLDICIISRYRTHTRLLKMQNRVAASTSTCSAFPMRIFIELVICSFHIPPGMSRTIPMREFFAFASKTEPFCSDNLGFQLVHDGNACYLDYQYQVEAMGIFMVMRLYLLGRFLRSSSSLNSQWVAFIGSLNDVNVMRPLFHFKAMFKMKPLHLILPLVALNTFLTAAIIRILERPVQPIFASYWKSVWLTTVTMSATGFGDFYPVTILGRAFTVTSAIAGGVLLVGLVQSIFFGAMELTEKERKLKYLVDLHDWEMATRFQAARIIQTRWKIMHTGSYKNKLDLFQVLYSHIRKAKRLRLDRPMHEFFLEEEESLQALERQVSTEIDETEKQKMQILRRIEEKALHLKKLKRKLEDRKKT